MSSVLGTSRVMAPYILLDLLAQAGWTVTIVRGDEGVEVTATLGALVTTASGVSLADVALPLYAMCERYRRGPVS